MTDIATIFETMDDGPAAVDPGPALRWLDAHARRFGFFVDGRWTEPGAGDGLPIIDPAREEVLARVASADAAAVDAAVNAARTAWPAWRDLPGLARMRHLYDVARQIRQHASLFAVIESLDTGMPIRATADDAVPRAARCFHLHAGWAQRIETECPGSVPVGVVVAIVSSTSPLVELARYAAPALAAGNTILVKPSEHTALTTLLFAELCGQAGLPAGVVNVITGDGAAGELLVGHPGVDLVAFSGSAAGARRIRAATAGSGKHLVLDINAPPVNLVFEDADIDGAVDGICETIGYAGPRVLVQEGIAERLTRRLEERVARLRIGDPLDRTTDVGAIASAARLDRVRDFLRRMRDEGITSWQPSLDVPARGYFFPPAIVTAAGPPGTAADEALVGPFATLTTFRTPAESLELAATARFAVASVWTEGIDPGLEIAAKLRPDTIGAIRLNGPIDSTAGAAGLDGWGAAGPGGVRYGTGPWRFLRPRWEAESIAGRTRGGRASLRDVESRVLGEVGGADREDVDRAVDAARQAAAWARTPADQRARVLCGIAEGLMQRAGPLAARITDMTDAGQAAAEREVELSIRSLFACAARTDAWVGNVCRSTDGLLAMTVAAPLGVLGVICPTGAPLLGFVSTVFGAAAAGNTVVAVPAEPWPLAAIDLFPIFNAAGLPAGVVNVVTGRSDDLADALAAHDHVDGVWCFGSDKASAMVERRAAGTLRPTWVSHGLRREWAELEQGGEAELLHRATRVRTIWIPYGE